MINKNLNYYCALVYLPFLIFLSNFHLYLSRQLEAIVRISEALAKMELQPFATERHVDEAMRLFQVSTLDAAHSGDLAGAEGFTTEEEHQSLLRIEKQLKKRFAIGSQVSEFSIVQDFLKQVGIYADLLINFFATVACKKFDRFVGDCIFTKIKILSVLLFYIGFM